MIAIVPEWGCEAAMTDSAGSGPIPAETGAREFEDFRNRFISEHLRRVHRLIYRIVHNPDDAQDLTQEVFIKVLQRQDQLRDPEKAAHWLSRIATNTAIDFLRRHGRLTFVDLEDLPPLVGRETGDSPEQHVLRSECEQHLEAGLSVLTGRERAALLLRDVEGLPAGEVARTLGCSQATVRSHISNARVKFRKYLERRRG